MVEVPGEVNRNLEDEADPNHAEEPRQNPSGSASHEWRTPTTLQNLHQ